MISIHAPREGSDHFDMADNPALSISIHAPREGSDYFLCVISAALSISIHAPREGSDKVSGGSEHQLKRFQSTLPVRGATANALKIGRIYAFYYSTSA